MNNQQLRQLRIGIVGGLLLVSSLCYLVLPFLVFDWSERPFPDFYIDPNLVVNSNGDVSWSSEAPETGIAYPDHIEAIDGSEIDSLAQYEALIDRYEVDDVVTVTLIQPDSDVTRDVQVVLRSVAQRDRLALFWFSYILGFLSMGIGLWTFRMRPGRESAQLLALFAVALAWFIGGTFETFTTQRFLRWYMFNRTMVGTLNLALALVFPKKLDIVKQNPWLRWAIFVPAIVIAAGEQFFLIQPDNPWGYSLWWQLSFGLTGIMHAGAFAIFGYRSWRTTSSLIQQQTRIILAAGLIGFLPIGLWYLTSWSFTYWLLAPMIIYPFTIGYVIIRYRLLDVDMVLRHSITYALLTATSLIIFVIVVAGISTVVGLGSATTNPILLAAFIVFITVAFDPLRGQLQEAVDRYFFRRPVEFNSLLRTYSRELSEAETIDEIQKTMNRYVRQGIPHSEATVYLLDVQNQHFLAYGQDKKEALPTDTPFVSYLSQELGALLLLTPEGEVQPGLERYKDEIKALGSALIVPMTGDDQLLGWISVAPRTDGRDFSTGETSYLIDVAEQSRLSLERANVIKRLESRLNEVDMLSQFSQALNFTVHIDDLLELVHFNVQRLLDIEDFFIHLRDPFSNRIYPAFHLEGDERIEAQEGLLVAVTDSRVMDVIKTGQSMVSTDEEGRPWVAVPLNAGTQTLGVMHTYRRDKQQSFQDRQVQLFQVYGDRVATALERWLSSQQLKSRARQLETLNQVTRSINTILDPSTLLDLILDKAIEMLEVEAGSFLLMHDDTNELEFKVVRGPVSDELIGRRLPTGAGLAGSVAQSGKAVIVNDVMQDERWFSRLNTGATDFVTHSVLAVPLVRQHQVVGVLQVVNKRDLAPFSQQDQLLLAAFAGQAVVAMENARLLEQTDTELQKRVSELSLLQQLDRELSMTLNLTEVLDLTLNWTLRVCNADAGMILLLEEYDGSLIRAMRGYDGSFDRRQFNESALETTILGEVVESREIFVCKDVMQVENYLPVSPYTRSQLIVPMVNNQEILGLVVVDSNKANAFNDELVTTLMRAITHAAVAITNALLYEQVKAANLAKSEFVSMVSHELKTPMTSIRGYIDLILSGMAGEVSPQQKKFLETSLANVRHMNRLVLDLTDLSRIETGQLSVKVQETSVPNIVSETLQTTQRICEDKNIRVELDMPTELPLIMADPQRLMQVLTNLLSNACKYSPTDTWVNVTFRADEIEIEGQDGLVPVVICTVQDHGYGISEEDQARLFTKFFRSDNPDIRQAKGTGLGLSITKGIVEVQGGKIWFDSELGKGTAFHFAIPQA
ncbi:MAG TPA: GAF domain-containing protein [Anaerolineae bacterium]|nr:GAF domain-containing protein [Anaerolineae bacterium]